MRWSVMLIVALLATCTDVDAQGVVTTCDRWSPDERIVCVQLPVSGTWDETVMRARQTWVRLHSDWIGLQVDLAAARGVRDSTAATLAECRAGDIDGDGVVGTRDLAILRARFGEQSGP